MTRRLSAASVWLVLLALAGLLAGHVASYFVVAPDAHERAELLAVTGHGEHSLFGTIALAAGFAAVIGLFMQTVRRRCNRTAGRPSRAGVATLLWAVQTCGFVALETWERGHGLAGISELVHEPAFVIGLVAQVVVALVAAAVVLLVRASAVAWLRRFAPPATETEATVFPESRGSRPRDSVARAAWNLRGPPSPLGSPS
ncbi:MAG TPA: hypothetical protein VHJ76_00045 [Actinomycetota bacterium]|nr:hypothetical protein [Actinomycetota bacterium]